MNNVPVLSPWQCLQQGTSGMKSLSVSIGQMDTSSSASLEGRAAGGGVSLPELESVRGMKVITATEAN